MSDDEFDKIDLYDDNVYEEIDDDIDESDDGLSSLSVQKQNHKFDFKKYDYTKYNSVKHQPNSYNRLNKYERANILGIRAQQLTSGAPSLLPKSKIQGITSVIDIAKIELENNLIPLIISRPFPDGSYEYWKIEDLNTF